MNEEGRNTELSFFVCLLISEPNGPSRWKPVQWLRCARAHVRYTNQMCVRIISTTTVCLSRKPLNKPSALRRCCVRCGPEQCEASERRADIAFKKAFRGTIMPCRWNCFLISKLASLLAVTFPSSLIVFAATVSRTDQLAPEDHCGPEAPRISLRPDFKIMWPVEVLSWNLATGDRGEGLWIFPLSDLKHEVWIGGNWKQRSGVY